MFQVLIGKQQFCRFSEVHKCINVNLTENLFWNSCNMQFYQTRLKLMNGKSDLYEANLCIKVSLFLCNEVFKKGMWKITDIDKEVANTSRFFLIHPVEIRHKS